MIIGITGARKTSLRYEQFTKILDRYRITSIVHGGAQGVDEFAQRYAEEHDIPVLVIKPEYSRYGIYAPLLRNKTIVEKSDLLLAFPSEHSRGTLYTINYAKRINKKNKVFES